MMSGNNNYSGYSGNSTNPKRIQGESPTKNSETNHLWANPPNKDQEQIITAEEMQRRLLLSDILRQQPKDFIFSIDDVELDITKEKIQKEQEELWEDLLLTVIPKKSIPNLRYSKTRLIGAKNLLQKTEELWNEFLYASHHPIPSEFLEMSENLLKLAQNECERQLKLEKLLHPIENLRATLLSDLQLLKREVINFPIDDEEFNTAKKQLQKEQRVIWKELKLTVTLNESIANTKRAERRLEGAKSLLQKTEHLLEEHCLYIWSNPAPSEFLEVSESLVKLAQKELERQLELEKLNKAIRI